MLKISYAGCFGLSLPSDFGALLKCVWQPQVAKQIH